jgi:hypothetical protein
MELWYPHAIVNRAVRTGGAFDSRFPRRGVFHTTEGASFRPSPVDYGGWHKSYPHFTIIARPSGVEIYQHIPIDTAARALRRGQGIETNKAGAIQIEIVGRAAESRTFSDDLLTELARWMRWVETQAGVARSAPLDFIGEEAAGVSGPARMSASEWASFNGWCGHQHVPANTHWDPGRLDIDRLIGLEPGRLTTRPLLVTNVAPDDVLNVRAAPDHTSAVVHTFAPTFEGVSPTGPARHVDGQTWLEVEVPGGNGVGWVNDAFLAEFEIRNGSRRHRVRRVAAGDVLNVRFRPGVGNDVIADLAPTAGDVPATGKIAWIGSSEWLEIRVGDTVGWANRHFLEPVA